MSRPSAAPYAARGERRLLLAVLNDAIVTLVETSTALDREARRLFAETEEWLASTDGAFSFAGVCAVLGLDADRLRTKIGALVELRREAEVAPLDRAPAVPTRSRISA